MIRLLSVQPVAERGGSDHLLVRMLRSLPPDDFECHVALPGRSPLAEEFAAAGASLHTVPMERLSTSHGAGEWAGYGAAWPVAVARLVRLIRRLRVDVVHSNSLHSLYGWAAAAVTGRPHVWHAREIVVQSRAALQLERFLARHFAVKVVCMSQAIADQLDPANVEIVYETVDPAEFRPELAGDLDRFVLPSTEPEPYGIVVVEALASGAPVVVTDAGGAPEIVARAEPGSGTTVPPGDAAALAAAIVRIAPVTTAGAARRLRPALQPAAPTGRFAGVFREAVGGGPGAH